MRFSHIKIFFVVLLFFSAIFYYTRPKPIKSVWTNGWQTVSSLTIPRRALAAVVHNRTLYAIGGMNSQGKYVTSVEYAKILDDGTLGKWIQTSSLNEGRFYLAGTSLNGYLYALGGAKGARGNENLPISSVERAKTNKDGSLGPWELDSYLTTPRRGLKAVVHNSHIYATGGYNGIFLKSIERGTIEIKTGRIQWTEEKNQTQIDRYIHSAAINNNSIYVLGGHMQGGNTVSYGDVEKATLKEDGSLGPWEVAQSNLLTPRFMASSFSLGKYLYLIGGHDGKKRLYSVEKALLSPKGQVGRWEMADNLRFERSGAAVAVLNNSVYVLGGSGSGGALSKVEMAKQGINGDLGFYREKK